MSYPNVGTELDCQSCVDPIRFQGVKIEKFRAVPDWPVVFFFLLYLPRPPFQIAIETYRLPNHYFHCLTSLLQVIGYRLLLFVLLFNYSFCLGLIWQRVGTPHQPLSKNARRSIERSKMRQSECLKFSKLVSTQLGNSESHAPTVFLNKLEFKNCSKYLKEVSRNSNAPIPHIKWSVPLSEKIGMQSTRGHGPGRKISFLKLGFGQPTSTRF